LKDILVGFMTTYLFSILLHSTREISSLSYFLRSPLAARYIGSNMRRVMNCMMLPDVLWIETFTTAGAAQWEAWR
jgi:hypothetical protein